MESQSQNKMVLVGQKYTDQDALSQLEAFTKTMQDQILNPE